MSHQQNPHLLCQLPLLGRAVLPLSSPTPGHSFPPQDWRTQGRAYVGTDMQPPPAGGTGLRVCSLCRCLPGSSWAGWVGQRVRMRVGDEYCPQNFTGQGKAGALGMTAKMPSPKPWILLKKARNGDPNLSPNTLLPSPQFAARSLSLEHRTVRWKRGGS